MIKFVWDLNPGQLIYLFDPATKKLKKKDKENVNKIIKKKTPWSLTKLVFMMFQEGVIFPPHYNHFILLQEKEVTYQITETHQKVS